MLKIAIGPLKTDRRRDEFVQRLQVIPALRAAPNCLSLIFDSRHIGIRKKTKKIKRRNMWDLALLFPHPLGYHRGSTVQVGQTKGLRGLAQFRTDYDLYDLKDLLVTITYFFTMSSI